MTKAFRENWKRLSDKGTDRYNTGDDEDIVRFKDQFLLTTNASGINGDFISGTPTEGDGLIFQNGQWVIALTNASGINGIPIVGSPSNGSGLIFQDGQFVYGLANSSGLNGIQIIGIPSPGDGLIFDNGVWNIALTNASGLNGIQIVGAPSIGEVLKFDGTNWTPSVDASGANTLSQVQVVNRTDVVLCNVAIPTDNSIPQITEGVQVLSRTFTASSAANRLHFRFSGYLVGAGTSPVIAVMALFRVGVASALFATAETLADDLAGIGTRQITFNFFIDAPDTSAHEYTVRIGPHLTTGSRTITVNDSSILGGVVFTSLEIWEATK